MIKALDLAKKMREDLGKNWLPELKDYDLDEIFKPIYQKNISAENGNILVCYIIYAYSPESLWLNLKIDRIENKRNILSKLGADMTLPLFDNLLFNSDEIIKISIFDYLQSLKSWKFGAIFELLDYSAKMFRFASSDTEEEIAAEKMSKDGEVKTLTTKVDPETIAKINKEKGNLLEMAIENRKKADTLLEEIKKEFVTTDNAVQADFSFVFTDTSTKKDILSWRTFIKERNERKASKLVK